MPITLIDLADEPEHCPQLVDQVKSIIQREHDDGYDFRDFENDAIDNGIENMSVTGLTSASGAAKWFDWYATEINEIVAEVMEWDNNTNLDNILPNFDKTDPLCLGEYNRVQLVYLAVNYTIGNLRGNADWVPEGFQIEE